MTPGRRSSGSSGPAPRRRGAGRRARPARWRRPPGRPWSRRAWATSLRVRCCVARQLLQYPVEQLDRDLVHAAAAGRSARERGRTRPGRARQGAAARSRGPRTEVDRLSESPLVAHGCCVRARHPQQPADRVRRDPGPAPPGHQVALRTELGQPRRHPAAAEVTPEGTVSVETSTTWSQRVIASSTTTSRCRGRSITTVSATPPGREHLAHRKRLQRGGSVRRPGQHRADRHGEVPRASTVSLSRPVVCSIESHRMPSLALEAEDAVDARPDRVRVDKEGRADRCGRVRQRRREHRRSGTTGPPETPIVTPGAAPPSPTSVSSSTSHVSDCGSPATVSAPIPRASRNSASSTGARPRTKTRCLRGGFATARGPAQSEPTSTTGAAFHQRRACPGSPTTRTTPAAALEALHVRDEQRVR